MDKPKRLYKYQSFTAQSLANLKDRQLWFSRPSRFNDPYDCAIRINSKPITDEEFSQVFQIAREEYKAKNGNAEEFDAQHLRDGQLRQEWKAYICSIAPEIFEQGVENLLNGRGVCCFSEKVDDPLMWSHYADGHRGFCLEFDTSLDAFQKAIKVRYSKDIPSISSLWPMLAPNSDWFNMMMATKADCWAYEQE